MLTWAGLVNQAAAESARAADESGPWGFGGSYLFGFFAGFAIFAMGVAWRMRKSHLAESGK
jgi:hypothetical protein